MALASGQQGMSEDTKSKEEQQEGEETSQVSVIVARGGEESCWPYACSILVLVSNLYQRNGVNVC